MDTTITCFFCKHSFNKDEVLYPLFDQTYAHEFCRSKNDLVQASKKTWEQFLKERPFCDACKEPIVRAFDAVHIESGFYHKACFEIVLPKLGDGNGKSNTKI